MQINRPHARGIQADQLGRAIPHVHKVRERRARLVRRQAKIAQVENARRTERTLRQAEQCNAWQRIQDLIVDGTYAAGESRRNKLGNGGARPSLSARLGARVCLCIRQREQAGVEQVRDETWSVSMAPRHD